jgi:hypothetical protein
MFLDAGSVIPDLIRDRHDGRWAFYNPLIKISGHPQGSPSAFQGHPHTPKRCWCSLIFRENGLNLEKK